MPRVDPETCESDVPGFFVAGTLQAGKFTNRSSSRTRATTARASPPAWRGAAATTPWRASCSPPSDPPAARRWWIEGTLDHEFSTPSLAASTEAHGALALPSSRAQRSDLDLARSRCFVAALLATTLSCARSRPSRPPAGTPAQTRRPRRLRRGARRTRRQRRGGGHRQERHAGRRACAAGLHARGGWPASADRLLRRGGRAAASARAVPGRHPAPSAPPAAERRRPAGRELARLHRRLLQHPARPQSGARGAVEAARSPRPGRPHGGGGVGRQAAQHAVDLEQLGPRARACLRRRREAPRAGPAAPDGAPLARRRPVPAHAPRRPAAHVGRSGAPRARRTAARRPPQHAGRALGGRRGARPCAPSRRRRGARRCCCFPAAGRGGRSTPSSPIRDRVITESTRAAPSRSSGR